MHYFVMRRGDPPCRIGVAKDGELTYVYELGDELRLADYESAQAFQRAVEHANLHRYTNLQKCYEIVKVNGNA